MPAAYVDPGLRRQRVRRCTNPPLRQAGQADDVCGGARGRRGAPAELSPVANLSGLGFRQRLRYRPRAAAVGLYPVPQLRLGSLLSVPMPVLRLPPVVRGKEGRAPRAREESPAPSMDPAGM